MTGIGLLGPVWVTLGVIVIVAGILARRRERALQLGLLAVSALWVLAGAGANAVFLLTGANYSGFADGADIQFVTDTWESLVVPHHHLFIALLIAFEAIAGAMVLIRGVARQSALILLMGFNLALLSFGWAFAIWSVPMTIALGLLFKAERRRLARKSRVKTASPARELIS
jgi:hypothetical protein